MLEIPSTYPRQLLLIALETIGHKIGCRTNLCPGEISQTFNSAEYIVIDAACHEPRLDALYMRWGRE
jgi:hypothetical protein